MKIIPGGRLWPISLILLCSFGWASVASANQLYNVRCSNNVGYTRVVMDFDALPSYVHRPLADPPRILIEFPSGSLASTEAIAVNDGYVKQVRRQKLSDGRIQVVLDLERGLSYTIDELKGPPRVYVDVLHTGDPAPAVPDPPKTQEKPAQPEPAQADVPEDRGAVSSPDPTPTKASQKRPTQAQSPRTGPWIVAVDPGHGEEPGAIGFGVNEKDITLSLAKLVVEELNNIPGIQAFLTRKGDYYVPLWKRPDIATDKNADMFVSIHCNASENPAAKGTEVYFLSLERASDEAAKELAERENSVDREMGIDASAPDLDKILFDMIQADVLAKSEYLAETCLENLFGLGTVYNRGVKQAGFAVLHSPSMPSILVEAAFITNKRENELLQSRDWQRMFSRLLADGISTYCRSLQEAEPSPTLVVKPERD